MPRSRGGAGPSRSAPSRPVAAPARPAAPPQQQRAASTAAHPPMQQQAPAQSQGSGLFGQMASTAAGVAVGSSIGHAIGGFFGGGGSAPAEAQQQQVAAQGYDGQQMQQQGAGACEVDIRNFTTCMNENRGDMNICGWYMEQLKACQQAARTY